MLKGRDCCPRSRTEPHCELDETYVSGKLKNRRKDVTARKTHGRYASGKAIVLGAIEHGGQMRLDAGLVADRQQRYSSIAGDDCAIIEWGWGLYTGRGNQARDKLPGMWRAVQIAGGIVLAILLNVTANKLPDDVSALFLKWGWFSILLYFTCVLLLTEPIRRRFYKPGTSMITYLIAGLIGAGVAVGYWGFINAVSARIASEPPNGNVRPQGADSAYRNQLYREFMQAIDDGYNTAGQRQNLLEVLTRLTNAAIAFDPYIASAGDRRFLLQKSEDFKGFCIAMAQDKNPRSDELSKARAENYFKLKEELRAFFRTKLFEMQSSRGNEQIVSSQAELINWQRGDPDNPPRVGHTLRLRDGVPTVQFLMENPSKFPAFDVNIRLWDIEDVPKAPKSPEELLSRSILITIPSLTGNTIQIIGEVALPTVSGAAKTYGAQYVTRAGSFFETIKAIEANGKWLFATRVIRGDASNEVLFREVNTGFPLNKTGEVDW